MAGFKNASTLSRRGGDEPQQLVDRDGFCISCICICISFISSTHLPHLKQHTTHPPHDHHAMLLRGKPLTHPPCTMHHAPRTTHLSLKQTQTVPVYLAQERQECSGP
jgi:hypothetical protein